MAKKKFYDSAAMGGAMIYSKESDYANLPAKEVVKMYPKNYPNGTEGLNDGIKGIDRQIADDNKSKKRKEYPEKY